VDANYYNGSKPYTILKSDKDATLTLNRCGQSDSISSIAFPQIRYTRDHVLNIAIGGQFTATDNFQLHAGAYTDFSPVNSSMSNIFREINFYGLTFGISLKVNKTESAVGLKYIYGHSKPFNFGHDVTLHSNQFDLSVNSISFSWSLTLGL
jgi:hypothetical protein